ncbi:molybdopterin-guanine dinucleotide biosynthesis protein B [Paenibacillus sp. FSL K6-1217]|uniref:molybdopterin-guanine dinucleotide biosynthesis protein B n=1 Tax=Paenibacillus sp. FSL K6-1217 TaxID=2921466 RepID=UPI003254C1C2
MESQHAAVQRPVPVLQIVGYKNSGKTTLACRLIHALSAQGLRVGSAKHDAHQFRLDDPGTDSSKHLLHGAVETVLSSPEATRVMRRSATSLGDIAESMRGRVDLVIAEGFKGADYPKIALIRCTEDQITLQKEATNIRLWLTWEEAVEPQRADPQSLVSPEAVPVLPLKDQALADQAVIALAFSLLQP